MFSIEFGVLIVVMAAVLAGMAMYMRRALSGRWRSVGDTFGHGRQYEPQPGVPPPLPCIADDLVCRHTTWKDGYRFGEPPPPDRCPRCCTPDKYHTCEVETADPYDPGLCLTHGDWRCGHQP